MNNACQNDFRISDTGYIPDSYEEEGLHRISVGNVLKKMILMQNILLISHKKRLTVVKAK